MGNSEESAGKGATGRKKQKKASGGKNNKRKALMSSEEEEDEEFVQRDGEDGEQGPKGRKRKRGRSVDSEENEDDGTAGYADDDGDEESEEGMGEEEMDLGGGSIRDDILGMTTDHDEPPNVKHKAKKKKKKVSAPDDLDVSTKPKNAVAGPSNAAAGPSKAGPSKTRPVRNAVLLKAAAPKRAPLRIWRASGGLAIVMTQLSDGEVRVEQGSLSTDGTELRPFSVVMTVSQYAELAAFAPEVVAAAEKLQKEGGDQKGKGN